MEIIFDSVKELDKQAENSFNLKNGVLMEKAARGMAEYIRSYCADHTAPYTLQIDTAAPLPARQYHSPHVTKPCVQIICGSGDNGGDGFALARMLGDFCTVRTVASFEPKSPLCKLQRERLELLGIPVYTDILDSCDVLVDAVFGTGIHGELDSHACSVLEQMNAVRGYKVACDIPSGLNAAGIPALSPFVLTQPALWEHLKQPFMPTRQKIIPVQYSCWDLDFHAPPMKETLIPFYYQRLICAYRTVLYKILTK